MLKQLKAIVGVLFYPKQTMRELPSDRIYILAILAPLYFDIERASEPQANDRLYELLGSDLLVVLFSMIFTIVMLLLGAWITQQFLKLFRKRLSIIKLINIWGYSIVPSLFVNIIVGITEFFNPSIFDENLFTPSSLAMLFLAFASLGYTLFLYVYGIVVSPSEEMAGTNNKLYTTQENARL